MADPPAPALALREGDADVLRRGYGRRRCRGPAQRARIVLLAATFDRIVPRRFRPVAGPDSDVPQIGRRAHETDIAPVPHHLRELTSLWRTEMAAAMRAASRPTPWICSDDF